MSRRIRRKVMELSALYRVTQLINTSANHQQALDGCLEHLIELFQARRGSIMLLNEDRTVLRVESFKTSGEAKESEPPPGQSDGSQTSTRSKFVLKVGEGTEIIIHLLAVSKTNSLVDRIIDSVNRLKGAYCLLFLTETRMIAVRDPHGFRPLCLGKLGDAWVVASESCARI